MYALITGASSGIGRELALLLARKGYNLILVARREDRLLQVKNKLEQSLSIKVSIESIDLSSEENCKALIEKYDAYPIEILINNAGFGNVGFVSNQHIDTNLNMVKTNVIAPLIFTSWFCQTRNHGAILNVSSIAAFTTPPLFATYGATKSFLYSFGTATNFELKKMRKDIHITTLCPGSVATEFYRNNQKQSKLCVLSARECAKIALEGLEKKKELVIPTVSMKGTYLFTRFLPHSVMLRIQFFLQKKKLQ
ncbi:MAG: SDR family NAD(P)-dependent oxidoreductase [Clostridium sp.]|nr:SDR family NAD(P)-dependent oxidoreductase [Clostridium sp.]